MDVLPGCSSVQTLQLTFEDNAITSHFLRKISLSMYSLRYLRIALDIHSAFKVLATKDSPTDYVSMLGALGNLTMHGSSASVGLWLGYIKAPKLSTICLACAANKNGIFGTDFLACVRRCIEINGKRGDSQLRHMRLSTTESDTVE